MIRSNSPPRGATIPHQPATTQISVAENASPTAQPTVADGPRRSLRNRGRPHFADEMLPRGGSNLTASKGAASAQTEDSKPAVRRSNRIAAAVAMRAVESNSPMEDTEHAAKPSAEPSIKRRGLLAPQLLSNKRSRQPSSEVTRPDGASIAIAGGPNQTKPAAAARVEKDPFPMDDGWEALDIFESAPDGADHVVAVSPKVETEQISKATSQGPQETSDVTRPDGPSIAIASGPRQTKPAAAARVEKDPFPMDDGWEALDIFDSSPDGADHVVVVSPRVETEQISKAISQGPQETSDVARPTGPSIAIAGAIAGGPSQTKPAAAARVEKDPFPMDDGWEALDIFESAPDGADHVVAVSPKVETEQISKAIS